MMGIYYSILATDTEDNIDVSSQIATLTNLRLLQRMSNNNDRLDKMRFKCNVSYEFIQQVALSVHFDLGRYLLDFA
jgi:origin recognition complex subunit 5